MADDHFFAVDRRNFRMLQSRKGKPFGGIASFAATHCSASEVQARLAGQVLLNYVRAC